ncbi:PIN domain-containing protein [Microcoleus sp. CAWBG58]|uniref:PIN domain-containing protein n=1 Tax=Microcoleus sp. CAWBG58 TaxID=2841651 RepID=UPI0025E95481|nr:PIN domain-containing protein [Microcoleus sp. CAWBG58]
MKGGGIGDRAMPTAKCDSVVTYNIRDFVGIERFGIRAIAPAEFLRAIGALL